MDLLKKFFYRSQIQSLKGEIFRCMEEVAPFLEGDLTHLSSPLKAKLGNLEEKLETLSSLSLSDIVEITLSEEWNNLVKKQKGIKNLLSLFAASLEKKGVKGEKVLKKILFHPHYRNHSSLAPFISIFVKQAIHTNQKYLLTLFDFHQDSIALRSKIIEIFGQILSESKLDPLFSSLEKARPEEALDFFLALRKHVLPQTLKKYENRIQKLVEKEGTRNLGFYLLAYMRKWNLLEEYKKSSPPSLDLALAYSLHLSGDKLKSFFKEYFSSHPQLLFPFFETAKTRSLFTPSEEKRELIAMIHGKTHAKASFGLESILRYRPEWKNFLIEMVQGLPQLVPTTGMAFLKIIGELQDADFVPRLVQIYPNAPDLHQGIVLAVSKLTSGKRLEEILNHFKQRTHSKLVSEQIDRILEKKKKEKLQK